jgi:hypothetical protein
MRVIRGSEAGRTNVATAVVPGTRRLADEVVPVLDREAAQPCSRLSKRCLAETTEGATENLETRRPGGDRRVSSFRVRANAGGRDW